MIRSSKADLDLFAESFVWKDILDELASYIESARLEFEHIPRMVERENLTTPSVLVHLGDVSGRLKAFRFMQSILEVIKEQIIPASEQDAENEGDMPNNGTE